MIQIIIIIVCLFLLLWLLKVPRVKVIRIDPPQSGRYNSTRVYGPIGLKVWTVGLAVISALIPIWNIISVFVLILILFFKATNNDLSWIDTFPRKPNRKKSKIIQFLNKTLYD